MRTGLAGLLLLCMACQASAADASAPARPPADTAAGRGSAVYNNYCVRCHGVNADGNGRAAKMYNPRPGNLVESDKTDSYKELIIKKGGAALGRSQFMPPWDQELSNEQVADVIAFLASIQLRRP